MLSFLTILHPLVDACSVTVLVIGGMSWQRVLAYNALAFALQFPIGVMLDVRPCLLKGAFVVSLALTLAGVGLCAGGVGDGEDAVVTQILMITVSLVFAPTRTFRVCSPVLLLSLSAGCSFTSSTGRRYS